MLLVVAWVKGNEDIKCVAEFPERFVKLLVKFFDFGDRMRLAVAYCVNFPSALYCRVKFLFLMGIISFASLTSWVIDMVGNMGLGKGKNDSGCST